MRSPHARRRRLRDRDGGPARAAAPAIALLLAALLSTARRSVALATPRRTAASRRRATPPPERLLPSSHRAAVGAPPREDPLVCYYADEWMDADVRLALRPGSDTRCVASTSASTVPSKKSPPPLRSLLLRWIRAWRRTKEAVRTRLERCTVYVLECESGKYYVGSTSHRRRRLKEHFRGKRGRGSKWTRRHRPVRVLREFRRIPSKYLLGTESRVTAECMLEFGVNNVRGSMFCRAKDYHAGDMEMLTKFLGHYNDLSYRKLKGRLSRVLPRDPRAPAKKRRNRRGQRAGAGGRGGGPRRGRGPSPRGGAGGDRPEALRFVPRDGATSLSSGSAEQSVFYSDGSV